MCVFVFKLYACPAFSKYILTSLFGPPEWPMGPCPIYQKVMHSRDKNQHFNFFLNLIKGCFWTFRVLKKNLHFAQGRTNETFFGATIQNF